MVPLVFILAINYFRKKTKSRYYLFPRPLGRHYIQGLLREREQHRAHLAVPKRRRQPRGEIAICAQGDEFLMIDCSWSGSRGSYFSEVRVSTVEVRGSGSGRGRGRGKAKARARPRARARVVTFAAVEQGRRPAVAVRGRVKR